ncbi:uncharacterized protein LOC122011383 [Zingiber officinale]|uniref:Uncharacterized protein n=1 Tax=Zingiber officinale TaxID=94328 RepID=A0A8J5KMK4_ZINOF|nr:uncharacterized protein LOC122011383 [Zingiber officinale]KAG6484354.1 hypothetical protein ZIOFF_052869 [Zingiber officinale]
MSSGRKSTSSPSQKKNRVLQYVKAPLRVLCRARDFYVRSMTSCAGRIEVEGGAYSMGYPMASGPLPRNFSVASGRSGASEEDLQDLIRTASLRRARSQGSTAAAVPRSQSVAVARIDEDKECEFGDENPGGEIVLRSRSYAPGAERKQRNFA